MTRHLTEAHIQELADSGPEARLDAETEHHLSACGQCREELALARMVTEALDSIPQMYTAAPPELLEGVMGSLALRKRRHQRRNLIAAASATLAALSLIVLWFMAGGAATLVIELIETMRSVELVTRIASSVWRTIPVELFTLSALVLVIASATLGRLVVRGAEAKAEAS